VDASPSRDTVRVLDELGLAYDPSVLAPPSLRPYVVKPLPSALLVFRRDQDHRVVEWISLTDDSSTTLDDARCEHLRGALTLDVDPEGRLYVLSERFRRLTILDARGAVQSVLPWTMPGDPISVHCLDAGSFLIGTWKPGALYVLDREGHVLWSWTPGRTILAEARAVATGPDGAYHVADASLHRILAVTPSGRVVRQIGIAGSPGSGPGRFANPSMLEVDEEGGVLVCDTRNDRVVKLAADGSVAWEWPQGAGMPCRPTRLSMPWCARRLPGGGFVIADTYNFRVLELDRNRKVVRALGSCPIAARSLSLPRSAQRLGRGRYLIADTYNNRIVETDRHSRLLWHFGSGASEDLFWPRCTFRGPDGRTVIADSRNDRILVVGEHGVEKVIAEIGGGPERSTLRDPHDVLATPDGRLIVADTGNNRVVELDSDGGWLSTFPSPAAARDGWRLADPHNVTLDASGRLLISDTGHDRVIVLERRGGRITELRHLTLPDGDVTPLKEPRGCTFRFGHYFILDSGTPRVIIADARHRVVWSWDGALVDSPLAQVLRPPRWMTVVSPRRLLLTDSVNGRVLVLRLPRWWAPRSRPISA
jgi:outer membrane protein assembly factor BamB